MDRSQNPVQRNECQRFRFDPNWPRPRTFTVGRRPDAHLEATPRIELGRPGGYSTSGMAQAIYAATERWREEMQVTFARLAQSLTPEQRQALTAAQKAWERFYNLEGKFLGALRQTVHGTMFRVLGASIDKSSVRGRTRSLQHYIDEWVADSPTHQTAIGASKEDKQQT